MTFSNLKFQKLGGSSTGNAKTKHSKNTLHTSKIYKITAFDISDNPIHTFSLITKNNLTDFRYRIIKGQRVAYLIVRTKTGKTFKVSNTSYKPGNPVSVLRIFALSR